MDLFSVRSAISYLLKTKDPFFDRRHSNSNFIYILSFHMRNLCPNALISCKISAIKLGKYIGTWMKASSKTKMILRRRSNRRDSEYNMLAFYPAKLCFTLFAATFAHGIYFHWIETNPMPIYFRDPFYLENQQPTTNVAYCFLNTRFFAI